MPEYPVAFRQVRRMTTQDSANSSQNGSGNVAEGVGKVSGRKAHGYYGKKYGDGFEEPEDRSKILSARSPLHKEILESEERREMFLDVAYPYEKKLGIEEYYENKFPLQVELVKMQDWVNRTGQRVVVVFEGRDASGKGGTIRRFMEHLNPRGAHVVALAKPTKQERGQWYFQRYVQHLPSRGELALFDRSWYNRAGVERVMEFCSLEDSDEFLYETPMLEEMWVKSGIRLIKLYFSVSQKEQKRRFKRRRKDPLKTWKLSPVDEASLKKWDEYTEAKETMFYHTHTEFAPWYVVKSDDKMRARINSIRHVLNLLPYTGKDESVVYPPDPWIIARADEVWDVKHKDSMSHLVGAPELMAAG